MSDSVQPRGRQPTRLPRPWDSPGKNTGVGCHFLLRCMKAPSDPMDCSLPGSSVHGIFQARVLTNTGATYSAMPAYSRKTEVSQISIVGVDSLVSTPQITKPLPYTLQNTPFSHFVLIIPKCPTPILGRDLLSKFKAFLTIPNLSPRPGLATASQTYYFLTSPLPSFSINPIDWDTDNPSIASHHTPIYIHLKDSTKLPNQSQYPISQIHQQGLSPSSLSCCVSLLRPTHSPYNMPILLLKRQMAPTAWFKT